MYDDALCWEAVYVGINYEQRRYSVLRCLNGTHGQQVSFKPDKMKLERLGQIRSESLVLMVK